MTPYITFAGYSGSGKTTLLTKVIKYLKDKGYKIAALKHDGHNFEMDKEGKDTYLMKTSGAECVAIASKNKFAIISDTDKRLSFHELMKQIPINVDIIIGEGFKDEDIPKILVHRKDNNKPILYNDERNIIAVATNDFNEFNNVTNLFHINDYEKIAEFLIEYIKNSN